MDDEHYIRMAIEAARKCEPEDARTHPKVGVVVVHAGNLLTVASRGELNAGEHAEYTALERKLEHHSLVGATVYTTLEPCTSRSHPKLPCAERLIERKVDRVCIGMLDPNPTISGKGQRRLRDANITTDFFPRQYMAEVEELNREFVRQHRPVAPRSNDTAASPKGAFGDFAAGAQLDAEYHQPTSDLTSDRATPALAPQRLTIREKSAAEILGNLKGITLSHQFHKTVKDVYLGRWTREPGWQVTVDDLPSKLSESLWHCTFKEVGSGTLVMAVTVRDVSTLRPGDSVTVSGRISAVSQLKSVSLEDAIVRGDNVLLP
jgi:pyrimidine deaminase RibD-like protein